MSASVSPAPLETPSATRYAEQVDNRPVVWSVGLGLFVVLLSHGATVTALALQWWEYLNHGFALTALVGWVIWRDRVELLSGSAPWWPASLMVLAGAVLWFIGSISGIQSLEQLAFLLVLLSWAAGVLGSSQHQRLLPLAAYLFLSLPAWGLFVSVLQQITVAANAVLLLFSGVKATITGTYIEIPEGVFEVAAGCAGLSFFLSGLTVGVAYGEIVPLTVRGRWLALGLMTSLSLVSNWIRVFLLIMIGHWTKMQSPLIADHGWFGWVIFALMVVVFLIVSPRIEAKYLVSPERSAKGEVPLMSGTNGVSVHVGSGLGSQQRAVLGLTLMAAIGPIGALLLQRVPNDPSPATIADLRAAPDWVLTGAIARKPLVFGDSVTPKPWAPMYVGAESHQTTSWSRGQAVIQVDRLIFSGRSHRQKLFADGNVLARGQSLRADVAVGINEGTQVRSLRQALVRVDSSTNRAVLYWFRVGNRSTGVPFVGRMLQVPASLSRSAPSELIAASIPCVNDCESAFRSLQEFVIGSSPEAVPTRTP